jgi:hypothetical protein
MTRKTSSMMVEGAAIALNVVLFQLGWWCAVLGAAHHLPVLGPVVIALVLLVHVLLQRQRLQALMLVLLALVFGIAGELTLHALGMTVFADTAWSIAGVPAWIVALWALFATTLGSSLRWLQGRWRAGSLVGAVGAVLSYGAGARLGALELPAGAALPAIALLWALALPLLSELARRWEGPA